MTTRRTEQVLHELITDVDRMWHEKHGAPPAVAYHYTSVAALTGIVNTQKLRATASAFLNDSTELVHARDILRASLKHSAVEATLPEYRALFYGPVKEFDYASSKGGTSFVASLSGSKDDLPQWCMYGDRFSGVALGFEAASLVALDRLDDGEKSVGFFAIDYSADQQRLFFDWLVERWQRDSMQVLGPAMYRGESPLPHVAEAFGLLATAAISVLPRMKSKHFRSENEWRLAHLHIPRKECCPVYETEGGKPYVELDLSVDGKLPLVSVWLAPAVSNQESERAVRSFLEQHGYEDFYVHWSHIPLRGTPRVIDL